MSTTKRIDELNESQRGALFARDDRLAVVGDGLLSPFFNIQPGVIIGKDDMPMYDRPIIREKPSVCVVQWGRGADGVVRLGMIRQKRPPADDILNPDNPEPAVFAQVVMGYFAEDDSVEEAALREKLEEAGKSKVLNVEVLPFPRINLEPNTYATWHYVAFVEIDLSTVDTGHTQASEFITGTMYLPVAEILHYIKEGRDETGAYWRGTGTTLGPLMIFFAAHPECFPSGA